MLSVQNPYADSLAAMTAAANMLENQRNNYEQERLRSGENLYKAGEEEYLRKMDNRGFISKLLNPYDYQAKVAGDTGFIGEIEPQAQLYGGVADREQDAILNQMRKELDPTQFKSMMAMMSKDFSPATPDGNIPYGESVMSRADEAWRNRKQINSERNFNIEAGARNKEIGSLNLPKEYKGDRSIMVADALAKHQQLYDWAIRNDRTDLLDKVKVSFATTMNNIDNYWRTDGGNNINPFSGYRKGSGGTGKAEEMTHYEQTVYSGDKPIGRISMPISDKEFREGKAESIFYQELDRQIKAGKYKPGVQIGGMRKTGTGSDFDKSEKEIAYAKAKERATAFAQNKNLSDDDFKSWGYSQFVSVPGESGDYYAMDHNGNYYKGNKISGDLDPIYRDEIPEIASDKKSKKSVAVRSLFPEAKYAGAGGSGNPIDAFITGNKDTK